MSKQKNSEKHCLYLKEDELTAVIAGLNVLVRVIHHKNDEKNWEISEEELAAYKQVKAIQERLDKEYA